MRQRAINQRQGTTPTPPPVFGFVNSHQNQQNRGQLEIHLDDEEDVEI